MAAIKDIEPMTIYIEAPNATSRASHPTSFSLLMTNSNIHGWNDCGVIHIRPWEGQQATSALPYVYILIS